MFRRNKVVFLAALIVSVTLLVQPVASSPTPPVASFIYTPGQPILGDVVVFNASSSYDPDGGNISSYKWDFDDGTVITVLGPTTYHNYTTFGDYNVTLTVTDDQGEKGTTWQIVTVRDYPVASFTYSPAWPIVGETVTFNASLSTPEGGTIVSYEWDFADGNSVNVNVSVTTHVYTTYGNFNVTLTVTDSENLTDTTWAIVPVRDYPVADFSWSPQRPLVNEVVTFDASLSTPNGGTIMNYTWNFADGNVTTVTNPVITHVYTAEATYNVTLTVADSEGLTDTRSKSVWVRKLPVATFTYSPAAPLVNETVTFNASLSTPNGGTIVSYTWNFGDGSTPVTEADPITNHTYTGFGTFNVTLTITDSEDLTDTFTDTIRILINPVADFTHSPTWPIVNETVTFDASASYDPDRNIVNYTWNFDDGSPILTTSNPITNHTYTAENTYNVTLTVTDDDGLTDTISKLITVYSFLYDHDVAITNVTTSATAVYVGQTVNITVVAKNEGTGVETFTVTVYYGATSIGTQTVTNLLPGAEETLTFSWDTTGVPYGNYTISAQASLLPGPPPETDTADNTFIDGIVKVKIWGDINGDDIVDIFDLVIVGLAYGSATVDDPETPWDETANWNPEADLNNDGVIDIFDLVIVGIHYGETA